MLIFRFFFQSIFTFLKKGSHEKEFFNFSEFPLPKLLYCISEKFLVGRYKHLHLKKFAVNETTLIEEIHITHVKKRRQLFCRHI
jgi:hypothetical protein